MDFQNVSELPSQSFCTTCFKTVVGGRQGHAPCKILSF